MKGISELMEECNKAITEHVELVAEENKLKEDLKEVILKNWQIVLSGIKEVDKIRNTLVLNFNWVKNECSTVRKDYEHDLTIFVGSINDYWYDSVEIKLNSSGGKCFDVVIADDWDKENPFKDDHIQEWGVVLGTEEKASELLSIIYSYYAKVFQSYLDTIIPEKEETLRNSISRIKSILSDSHTVEEEEDGIVKIRLGGKTYIGTLLEENK